MLALLPYNINAQIRFDSYKNHTRRILTESKELYKYNIMLDVYAYELTKDTTYYIKIGFANLSDSIVAGNKFLIKVTGETESKGDSDYLFPQKVQISPDTTISLVCSETTNKAESSILYTQHSINYFNPHSITTEGKNTY